MAEILTAAQMRAVEQAAIASGQVTGLELMERAGRGVVEAVFDEWPELRATAHRAVVLCGPGNNGGDGFVVARLLKARGWIVSLYLQGEVETLPPDARTNHDRWRAEGGAVLGQTEAVSDSMTGFGGNDLIVDALFGIGLSRPIAAYWREVVDMIAWRDPGVRAVAVDIPSGFDADTGQIVDHPAKALAETLSYVEAQRIAVFDMTVTFHRAKPAHGLPPCCDHCGRVVIVDLGLDDV